MPYSLSLIVKCSNVTALRYVITDWGRFSLLEFGLNLESNFVPSLSSVSNFKKSLNLCLYNFPCSNTCSPGSWISLEKSTFCCFFMRGNKIGSSINLGLWYKAAFYLLQGVYLYSIILYNYSFITSSCCYLFGLTDLLWIFSQVKTGC